jgi:uncharacterized protein (DUF58 family)
VKTDPAGKPPPSSEPRATGLAALLTPEEMHRLSLLTLMSRYVVEGNLAGAHRSPLRGTSSEFSDHKAYGFGDNPRYIDWRVLGRTEKYFVKRFDDDTNLRVYFIVDRSRSMAYGSGGVTKYEYACRLVAALGYVVVKARDSAGLFLHADRIDASMEARNTFNHLNNIVETLQAHEPGSTTKIADALHQVAESVRHRALVVVLSDLLDDEHAISPALAHFRKRLHDVIVLQILDPMELDLGFKKNCEFEDLETRDLLNVDPRRLRRAYAEVFGRFLDHHREACAGMRIDYRIARTDHPLDEFVHAYLAERRRLCK